MQLSPAPPRRQPGSEQDVVPAGHDGSPDKVTCNAWQAVSLLLLQGPLDAPKHPVQSVAGVSSHKQTRLRFMLVPAEQLHSLSLLGYLFTCLYTCLHTRLHTCLQTYMHTCLFTPLKVKTFQSGNTEITPWQYFFFTERVLALSVLEVPLELR